MVCVSDLWHFGATADGEHLASAVCLGPMYFGHAYAGTFLRLSPVTDGIPIINASLGALMGTALVLEEQVDDCPAGHLAKAESVGP